MLITLIIFLICYTFILNKLDDFRNFFIFLSQIFEFCRFEIRISMTMSSSPVLTLSCTFLLDSCVTGYEKQTTSTKMSRFEAVSS